MLGDLFPTSNLLWIAFASSSWKITLSSPNQMPNVEMLRAFRLRGTVGIDWKFSAPEELN